MNILQDIKNKLITTNEWTVIRQEQHFQKVVFTNGCFDILHRGHVEYLAQARNLGDCLVIGLNTDSSVRRLKGNSRPINQENDRALLLSALQFVNYVILFEEDTPYNLICNVMPDILVKGSDYQVNQIVGADVVLQNGGSVQTIDFIDGYSSTQTIQKMSK